jgi:hypothetical protein
MAAPNPPTPHQGWTTDHLASQKGTMSAMAGEMWEGESLWVTVSPTG